MDEYAISLLFFFIGLFGSLTELLFNFCLPHYSFQYWAKVSIENELKQGIVSHIFCFYQRLHELLKIV